jgi:hypothetical protein
MLLLSAVNHFHQCVCWHSLKIEATLESDVSTEEEDGAYHEGRLCHVLRMWSTLLNVSVDNKLATGGISSISEFHDHENFGSSGEEKVRAHMTLHMYWVLLIPILPMKVFTALFYVHTIGKHDERNSLNVGLVLFHMKHEVSTKQMSLKRMTFSRVFK